MPTIIGYDHLSLTVTDVAKSAAWYSEVLGFHVMRRAEATEFTRAILLHPQSPTAIGLTHHRSSTPGDTFSELRTGLDHVAFAVPNQAEMDAWKSRFEALGVEHSEVKMGARGTVITLRDPDNIQLEVYAPPPAAPGPL